MNSMLEKIQSSSERLARWVEEHDYKAYDPGDGQLSFLRAFTFGQQFPRRVLTASVLRAPVNIRPLLGIRPHTSTKGMGYMAWGYAKQYAITQRDTFKAQAAHCLDWLMENRAPKYKDYCWGNSFAFSTRSGTIPAQEPTIVWSSLIGQAFLEAYEVFGNARYLEVASSICDWILQVPREKTSRGACLSYVAYAPISIHNSNMLGAAMLARTGSITGNSEALAVAREAMLYSCARLNEDGAWFYGEAPKYHWIDSFHTGYNLDSLKRYVTSTGDASFNGELERGLAYFQRSFFEADGRPRYYDNKLYPIDIQCAAQSIDTLAFFSDMAPGAIEQACKVASWTIDNMQDRDGHFYYRDLGWMKIRIPMLHWGQGTMFKALAQLAGKLQGVHTSATR